MLRDMMRKAVRGGCGKCEEERRGEESIDSEELIIGFRFAL